MWNRSDDETNKLKVPVEKMNYILATDVGSTTTKARFFEKVKNEWRFIVAGEAPTTVEEPYEDVTLGVRNAIREVEEFIEHPILSSDDSGIIIPYDGKAGVDLYCTTSSAGGGLQMLVAGVILNVTAESANRAALGAGAIVMDVMAINDERPVYQKIRRIRTLRPDMILLAGGTDGGTIKLVMEIAEIISSSNPSPRLGADYDLPLIYSGNKFARSEIQELMKDKFALSIVENLRPTMENENIEPTRRAIHELFMEHVMSHAPGYNKLQNWSDIDILPTPAGEGMAMQLIANINKANVLGVGLGGATTNVYSIFEGRFVRSVSANLGMSYSICNVLKETGINNIKRWIPFRIDDTDIMDRLRNKMIRPTTIPQTLEDLIIEHAVAREALRLGLEHHKTIATRLKGAKKAEVGFSTILDTVEDTYIKMMDFDIIAGTGGLLSHAPDRVQSMLILVDAWQPEGITKIFQDSVFMMPHLGVLSTVYADAAWQIFDKDCLIRVGTVIAPVGTATENETVLDIDLELPDGRKIRENIKFGEIKKIQLNEREAIAHLKPNNKFDIGLGMGKPLSTTVTGGVVGIVIDARGRPLEIPENRDIRKKKLLNWWNSLQLYPSDKIKSLLEE